MLMVGVVMSQIGNFSEKEQCLQHLETARTHLRNKKFEESAIAFKEHLALINKHNFSNDSKIKNSTIAYLKDFFTMRHPQGEADKICSGIIDIFPIQMLDLLNLYYGFPLSISTINNHLESLLKSANKVTLESLFVSLTWLRAQMHGLGKSDFDDMERIIPTLYKIENIFFERCINDKNHDLSNRYLVHWNNFITIRSDVLNMSQQVELLCQRFPQNKVFQDFRSEIRSRLAINSGQSQETKTPDTAQANIPFDRLVDDFMSKTQNEKTVKHFLNTVFKQHGYTEQTMIVFSFISSQFDDIMKPYREVFEKNTKQKKAETSVNPENTETKTTETVESLLEKIKISCSSLSTDKSKLESYVTTLITLPDFKDPSKIVQNYQTLFESCKFNSEILRKQIGFYLKLNPSKDELVLLSNNIREKSKFLSMNELDKQTCELIDQHIQKLESKLETETVISTQPSTSKTSKEPLAPSSSPKQIDEKLAESKDKSSLEEKIKQQLRNIISKTSSGSFLQSIQSLEATLKEIKECNLGFNPGIGIMVARCLTAINNARGNNIELQKLLVALPNGLTSLFLGYANLINEPEQATAITKLIQDMEGVLKAGKEEKISTLFENLSFLKQILDILNKGVFKGANQFQAQLKDWFSINTPSIEKLEKAFFNHFKSNHSSIDDKIQALLGTYILLSLQIASSTEEINKLRNEITEILFSIPQNNVDFAKGVRFLLDTLDEKEKDLKLKPKNNNGAETKSNFPLSLGGAPGDNQSQTIPIDSLKKIKALAIAGEFEQAYKSMKSLCANKDKQEKAALVQRYINEVQEPVLNKLGFEKLDDLSNHLARIKKLEVDTTKPSTVTPSSSTGISPQQLSALVSSLNLDQNSGPDKPNKLSENAETKSTAKKPDENQSSTNLSDPIISRLELPNSAIKILGEIETHQKNYLMYVSQDAVEQTDEEYDITRKVEYLLQTSEFDRRRRDVFRALFYLSIKNKCLRVIDAHIDQYLQVIDNKSDAQDLAKQLLKATENDPERRTYIKTILEKLESFKPRDIQVILKTMDEKEILSTVLNESIESTIDIAVQLACSDIPNQAYLMMENLCKENSTLTLLIIVSYTKKLKASDIAPDILKSLLEQINKLKTDVLKLPPVEIKALENKEPQQIATVTQNPAGVSATLSSLSSQSSSVQASTSNSQSVQTIAEETTTAALNPTESTAGNDSSPVMRPG